MKKYILFLILLVVTFAQAQENMLRIHRGGKHQSFSVERIDSIVPRLGEIPAKDSLKIFYKNSLKAQYSVAEIDSLTIFRPKLMSGHADEQAKSLKKKILDAKDELQVSGVKYYLSEKGNDANSGKSPQAPWKTLAKLSGAALTAGDAVFFERGSVFRGSIVTVSGVSYGAYGQGDKPCIYGAKENSAIAERWKQVKPNVWSYSQAVHNDIGLIAFNHGEASGIKKWKIDDVAQNFDYYHNLSDFKVYLYYDKGNPGELFSDIEFGEKKHIILLPERSSDVRIDNLCLKYGGAHGIVAVDAKNISITNVEIAWIGGSHHIHNGQVVRYGNAIECWDGIDGIRVENCYIYQIYDTGITFQGSSSPTMKNILYKANLIEYCTWSIEYWMSNPSAVITNVCFEDNILRFSGYGWGNQRPDKSDARHIKTWNYPNKSDNFVIKNNYFDVAKHGIFDLKASASMKYLPKMSNNVYAQYKGLDAGQWGNATLVFDNRIRLEMISFGVEQNPKVIFVPRP